LTSLALPRIETRIGPFTRRWLSISPIYLWLAALIVIPNLFLIIASVWKNDGGVMIQEWTLANYGAVIESNTYRTLMLRTLYTAFGAAVLASLIAYPMAYFTSLKLDRQKLTAVLLVIIPLWVSLMIRVFAWRTILGENGILNSFLVAVGILDEPSEWFLYTRFTVFLTLTYVAIPYVFIASYTALERIPRSLLEASHDSGAPGWRTFWHIVLPLSKQGLAIGFALAFLLAVADYITPSMVGGMDGTMLGVVVASQFGLAGNWPLGAAMAISLLVFVVVFLAIVARFARVRGVIEAADVAVPTDSRRLRPPYLLNGLRRALAWMLFVIPYGFLYLPLLTVAVFSFNDSKIPSLPYVGFTTRWYVALVQDEKIIAALERSLTVAGSTVAIALGIGTAFALMFQHMRLRGSPLLQGGLALPVALPGIVLGISLVITFQMIGVGPGVHRVIVGHLVFVMPVVMLIVLSRLRQLDPSYAQASMDLGANRIRTFIRVVLPMIRSALIGGGLLGFTLSFDEIIVTFFLSGVQPTLPVHVWNQLRFGFTPSVNAIFTCIGVFSFVLVLLATRILSLDLRGRDRARAAASAG
jgi:spermidine/putrescine transport system permease protein